MSLTETAKTETTDRISLRARAFRSCWRVLLPKITEVAIQRALLEATASEHGARMTAMDSATDERGEDDGHTDLADEPRAPGFDHARADGDRRHGGSFEVRNRVRDRA